MKGSEGFCGRERSAFASLCRLYIHCCPDEQGEDHAKGAHQVRKVSGYWYKGSRRESSSVLSLWRHRENLLPRAFRHLWEMQW